MAYCAQLKSSEAFELIIEDSPLESTQTDIVDFTFAHQIGTLNLQGIGKPERSCKVDRLQEILEQVLQRQPEVEAESEVAASEQTEEEEVN